MKAGHRKDGEEEDMAFIEVRDLTFAYDEDRERNVIDDMSFDIEKGTVTALTGLSGCGKSTLCSIMTGVIPAHESGLLSGSIRVDGEEMIGRTMREFSEKIGYVMQDPDRQIIATTVEDELAFGPENICLDPQEIRERTDSIMKLLGLEQFALADPGRLSGGQKQLTIIGSVLTLDPQILIMDEPFSHLDEEGRALVGSIMQKLRQAGKTILAVDHDPAAIPFADRQLIMEHGGVI